MPTFDEATENVREWVTGFAAADDLAAIHGRFPGFGEVWTQWSGVARRYRTAVLRHYGAEGRARPGGRDEREAVLARLDELAAALAAAREPFDAERPHVRGWARVMAAAHELAATLPRPEGGAA